MTKKFMLRNQPLSLPHPANGQLFITPSYVDLSNGLPWSSLDSTPGNQALAKAAIQQVCDDIRMGTRTAGADVHCTVNVGLNAVQNTPTDPFGNSLGSANGESIPFTSPVTKTYAAYRSLLLGLNNSSTFQQNAWNGLPLTPPTVNGSNWGSIFFSTVVLGMFNASDPAFFDNNVFASVGIKSNTGLDPHGLSSGNNFYELAFHEITEAILYRKTSFTSTPSVEPLDLYTFSAPGVRTVEIGTSRYLSPDLGTTNIGNLNTVGGSDPGDFAGLANDAFNAFGPNGPVSRSTSTPGQRRDWETFALYIPMSASGNVWGGMS